jgi:trehalose/maltose hydrolase-like predicted phosphorylase
MASYDGSEQCETWDIGCSEVHITADVVYAISKYCEASANREFYLHQAAKVYIETARYWLSRYTINQTTGEADLLFCKGPDEYCGITNNNLFTNIMVKNNLFLASNAVRDLKAEAPEELKALSVTPVELSDWKYLHDHIKLPHDPVTGHLTTDDTFHLLEPVAIKDIKQGSEASYHNVCFDRLQRYKVVKQADVLLLMTRFPEMFTQEEKITAWKDFEPLCLHDSTLSFASHALFAAQNGLRDECDQYFKQAIFLDLKDIMNNTGKEGLHLACLGEAWQVAAIITKGSEQR